MTPAREILEQLQIHLEKAWNASDTKAAYDRAEEEIMALVRSAALKEREECARLVENAVLIDGFGGLHRFTREQIAEGIRARTHQGAGDAHE